MTRDELEARLRRLVAEASGRGLEAAPDDADIYRDLGVRSTGALELLLAIEEAFGVAIPDEAFGRARTIAALAALVRRLQ